MGSVINKCLVSWFCVVHRSRYMVISLVRWGWLNPPIILDKQKVCPLPHACSVLSCLSLPSPSHSLPTLSHGFILLNIRQQTNTAEKRLACSILSIVIGGCPKGKGEGVPVWETSHFHQLYFSGNSFKHFFPVKCYFSGYGFITTL